MKFAFKSNYYGLWQDEARKVYNFVLDCVKAKKPFVVEVRPEGESKTPPQLRAVHCLIDQIIPHLEKEFGKKFSTAEAKKFIKYEIGYVRPLCDWEKESELRRRIDIFRKKAGENPSEQELAAIKEVVDETEEVESFALANKDKMIDLINQILEWCRDNDLHHVKLENLELMRTLSYFKE